MKCLMCGSEVQDECSKCIEEEQQFLRGLGELVDLNGDPVELFEGPSGPGPTQLLNNRVNRFLKLRTMSAPDIIIINEILLIAKAALMERGHDPRLVPRIESAVFSSDEEATVLQFPIGEGHECS